VVCPILFLCVEGWRGRVSLPFIFARATILKINAASPRSQTAVTYQRSIEIEIIWIFLETAYLLQDHLDNSDLLSLVRIDDDK
jgi:hypothetical protein